MEPPERDLLEREGLLADLTAALRAASSGKGRTVLAYGEAGIGKTSLVDRFCQGRAAEARVLWGGCEALFTARPLGPLRDIARQTLPEMISLLDREAPRATLFAAFLDELAAGPRPTVAVFEDVHWADEATLDLIKFLGRRIHRVSALFIVTYRDDEVGPRHPLRVVIGDLPAAAVIRLWVPPLSEAAVLTLARRAQQEVTGLYTVTGGNPFFVTEVLAAGHRELPPTVRDAVLARASRLSRPARQTLEAASLVPPRTERRLLLHILAEAADALDECTGAGMLIAEDGWLRFRHELARRAVEETVAPEARRALHQRILQFLEQMGPVEPARLAYHAEAAGVGEAVLEYATAAARQAAANGAHRQAFEQYARAIRFAHGLDTEALVDLYEGYANECQVTDHIVEGLDARRHVLALRREAGDRRRMGSALVGLSLALWRAGRGSEVQLRSQEAIDLLETLPAGPDLARAYSARGYLCMLARDADGAIAWGQKGIELAGKIGATEALLDGLNAVGSTEIVLLERAEGIARLEEMARLARAAGLDEQEARAYSNLGSASGEIRDYATAGRYLEQAIAFAEQRDLDGTRHYCIAWLARIRFEQGRWAEAGDLAAKVASKSGISPISPIVALTVLGRIRARRGDPGAKDALEQAWTLAEATGDLQRLWPAAAGRAELAWLSGRQDRIPAIVGETLAMAHRLRSRWAIGELAYWMWKAGRSSAPPENAAEPFAQQIAGNWRDAAAHWDRIECPYERAMAHSEGDDETPQKAALEVFERLGARPMAETVRRSLRARGARRIPRGPRAATRINPAGLTSREGEVLGLLAEGLQNAEIASRLVLSPKTVDHHISAILAKLDVRSRTEAVAAAYRLGIIRPR